MCLCLSLCFISSFICFPHILSPFTPSLFTPQTSLIVPHTLLFPCTLSACLAVSRKAIKEPSYLGHFWAKINYKINLLRDLQESWLFLVFAAVDLEFMYEECCCETQILGKTIICRNLLSSFMCSLWAEVCGSFSCPLTRPSDVICAEIS